MSNFRTLTPDFSVAPQIQPEDVAAAAAAGCVMVINNRPDDEEMGQPHGTDIAAEAERLGLAYVAIPVTHAGFSHAQIDAMEQALAAAGGGPVLAFCRSGTRSTNLWALTRARLGDDPDQLARAAASAGYDLSGIRPTLDALAAGAR